MNEDYVTYEQAVQLKELGFSCGCIGFYDHYKIPGIEHYNILNESQIIKENYNDDFIAKTYNVLCSAPTLSQVQKWFREIHGIDIDINSVYHKLDTGNKVMYSLRICNQKTFQREFYLNYDSYKEALSVGIDHALKILKNSFPAIN